MAGGMGTWVTKDKGIRVNCDNDGEYVSLGSSYTRRILFISVDDYYISFNGSLYIDFKCRCISLEWVFNMGQDVCGVEMVTRSGVRIFAAVDMRTMEFLYVGFRNNERVWELPDGLVVFAKRREWFRRRVAVHLMLQGSYPMLSV